MTNTKELSLYHRIVAAATEDGLPNDFSVRQTEAGKPSYADGMQDGVRIFHMEYPAPFCPEAVDTLRQALKAAADGDDARADALFHTACENRYAIQLEETLLRAIIAVFDVISITKLLRYVLRTLLYSCDNEIVKLMLMVLCMLHVSPHPLVREVTRTLGLSDEYTYFCIQIMSQWRDGNEEIFRLAQKTHGWGRVCAIRFLSPSTPQIRRWFLLEAANSAFVAFYTATTCWEKSGALTVLRRKASYKELAAIGRLLNAIIDSAPLPCSALLEDAHETLLLYAQRASTLTTLQADDYETILNVRDHAVFDEPAMFDVAAACNKALQFDTCKAIIRQSLENHEKRFVPFAREFGLTVDPES